MNILSRMLAEALSESPILEMAIDRRDFLHHVRGQIPQVLQNWTLVKYASQNDIRTINHWRDEFIASVLRVGKFTLKKLSGSKDIETRRKAILTEFERANLTTNPAAIHCEIWQKLKSENISPVESKQLSTILIKEIPMIIEMMLTDDYFKVEKYINSI